MARERWFFAQGTQRRGPVPFQGLVETVLAQPDPRAVLVWRKGFADWTRADHRRTNRGHSGYRRRLELAVADDAQSARPLGHEQAAIG